MPDHTSRWRALGSLILPDARRYALLTGAVVVSSALVLAGPLLLKTLIDRAAAGATTGALAVVAGWYLAVAVANQSVTVAVSYMATSTAWRTANALRLRLAAHVLGLDHEFHRSHSPGEMIERVDGDVTSVSDFLAMVAVRVSSALILVFGVIVVVTVIDWRLGVAMTLYVATTAAVLIRRRHHSVAEAETEMSAGARLLGGIEERLTAAEDLRAAGAGDYALDRFVDDTANYVGAALGRERAFLVLWRNLNLAIALGAAATLALGAVGVARGVLTVGSAFLLFQYSQQIRRPLEDILHELELVQKANGAMSRVLKLLATSSAVVDSGRTSPPPGALAVSLRQVSFRYDDDSVPALCEIDLEVGAGRVVGVVGPTGSGKTSLSRLLCRLVDVSEGELLLSGVPIADISMDELRRRVAVIPQTVDLFAGSVADNLTLFDPERDADAVDDALRRVGLDEFAGRADEVVLGPGGSGLSAGQGQLLALARVWLRQPDLVVLDEATARIDPVGEQRLERALRALFAERTVFVIAHRLSTLSAADDILVIEAGRVVEFGARVELAADPEARFAGLLRAGHHVGEDLDVTIEEVLS